MTNVKYVSRKRKNIEAGLELGNENIKAEWDLCIVESHDIDKIK